MIQHTYDSMTDKEVGKTAVIAVLGPSLNDVLPQLEEASQKDRYKSVFYSCNFFSDMTKLEVDYWTVINSQGSMSIGANHQKYNTQPNATFVYSPRIHGFSIEDAKKYLEVDHFPMNDFPSADDSIQKYVKKFTGNDTTYNAVETVLLHMTSLAIIHGCYEIYVAGADLNYDKGYVTKGVHEAGVSMGKRIMNGAARKKTVEQMKILDDCAMNVGAQIFTLNENSPLADVLDYRPIEEVIPKLH